MILGGLHSHSPRPNVVPKRILWKRHFLFPAKIVSTTFILLLFSALTLNAQWIDDPSSDEKVQRAINHIYNLQFYDANRTIDSVIWRHPNHPAGYFFRAMVQWWRILSNFDDESQDDRFYKMLEDIIGMCDERLDEDPDDLAALFFKGGSLGFRGRLRANRGKWLGAASDGIAALPIVRKAYEIAPDNFDVLLGIGIYNYYAEVIPERYPLVKPFMIFFPSGDRTLGLEQLTRASENARYASVEATYFLMQNYYMYEKDFVKALPYATRLHSDFPNNPIFHRYLGRCYVSLARWDDAYSIFEEVRDRCDEGWLGYNQYEEREAYYYIGTFLFQSGRFDEALQAFQTCDSLSRILDGDEASGFMSMANLTIGMIYDTTDQRDRAVEQYEKVLDMEEYRSTHQDADYYLKHPYKRN